MFSFSRTSPFMFGAAVAALVISMPALARPTHFNVPAQSAASGIQAFARQAGVQLLVQKEQTDGKRTGEVKGNLETRDGLSRLLRGTGLEVLSIEGTVITLGRREIVSSTPRGTEHGASSIVVMARRSDERVARRATAVVDAVHIDDVATLAGGDGSVVEQLITLPGITGVEEGDTPRFISIRGISANLNSTLIDGIALASIGSDGDGSRQVNLQLVPSNMSSGNEVYKSFTPELPGDAIGGVVNVVTRSAFDKDGLYTLFDANAIYSTFRGPAGINAITGSGAHWGKGLKGVVSSRFGADGQFGIVVTGEYQDRVRNSSKYWQATKYYFSDAGKKLASPEDPNWNGLIVPYDQQYASYTNQLRSYGGSAKLEWASPDERFYASILGFGRRRYEDSTMNKQDYYTKNSIFDQTEAGGRQQINSIYTRYRHDDWNRRLFGGIGNVEWTEGKSHLQVRGGYTKALYDNHQTSLVARAYPTSAFLTYSSEGRIPHITSLSDSKVLDPKKTPYLLSTAYDMNRVAREDMGNARIDYSYNAGADDRGVGFVVGAEWRDLVLRRNLDELDYKVGRNMADYLFTPDYTAAGAISPMPWISYGFVSQMPTLAVDKTNTAYNSAIGDYRYAETVVSPFASLHYTAERFAMVWGLRFDHTRFTADTPQVSNGAIAGTARSHGGYEFVLPSLSAEYKLTDTATISASASRTLGRPTPGDIAQAESTSCGEQENGSEGCVISRGNPDLQPRRATNLDFTATQAFNRGKGLVGVSLFAKWIDDDIYNLTSQTSIGDTVYKISQPMNSSGSRIMGAEMRVENKGIKLAGQKFDIFANLTLMKGHMEVTSDGGVREIDRLLYQPAVLANAGVTWHTPFLHSAFTARYNYRGKYLESVGASPWLDEGRAGYGTLDLSLTQRITSFATLKYEFYNALGEKPRWLMGENLQYYTEADNYGRTAFVHLIIR